MSGIAAHLRNLEQEARDAEKDLEDYRDLYHRKSEAWNEEVNDLVLRVQQDKAALREQLEKKQLTAKKKNDEVQGFRDTLNTGNNNASTTSGALSTRLSTNEVTRTTRTSVDAATPSFSAINQNALAIIDSPRNQKAGGNKAIPAMSSINKYFPDLPVICRTPNGNWVEIRCFVCHGNFIDKKGWIRGTRGMLAHVSKSHKVEYCNGTRLDSINILQFCTVRELSDEDAQGIADGETKVDLVNCLDVGTVELDYKIEKSTPKSTPKRTNGVEKETNGDLNASTPMELDQTPIKFDDWYQKYPTIVMTKSGSWVELRCDICGGNSLANSDRRFAQGVIGFVRHLSRGHGIRPDNANKRLDWALERCTYREVTQSQIDSIASDINSPHAPQKVPFKQQDVSAAAAAAAAAAAELDDSVFRDSLNSVPGDPTVVEEEEVLPSKRRPSKRSLKTLDLTDEETSEEALEQADSDFQPEGRSAGPSKRARHSLAASSLTPKISTRRKTTKGANSQSVPASPLTPSVKGGNFLDKFCPCSVAGHSCQDENCKRQQLCSSNNHDESCSKLSHETRPTCVMGLLSEECPDGDSCTRGHDMIEDRKKKAIHDCKGHS